MAPRFVLCPACNRHAHPHERQCPFCDSPFGPEAARSMGAGVALTVGLSLVAGCEQQPALAQTPGNTRVDAATARAVDAANVGLGSLAPDASDTGHGPGTGFGVYGGPPLAARRPDAPVLRALPPSVEGALSVEAVRRVVLRNLGQVARCFEQAGDGGVAATGRVAVRFAINAQGLVGVASVESSSLPTTTLGACVAAAVRRWQFPTPERGMVTVQQTYTMQVPSR